MHTAGRPASPTIHPRTRPEANEFAVKNRSTNDWFRHDGKNVEAQQAPPERLQGSLAPEIAHKAKGTTVISHCRRAEPGQRMPWV